MWTHWTIGTRVFTIRPFPTSSLDACTMTSSENPFDTPVPKGVSLVQGTLRVVVAIQCWGMAAARLHHDQQTPLSEFLANGYDLGADKIPLLEDYAAYALIGCGLLTLLRPCWPVLIPVVVWQAAIAITTALAGEGTIPLLEPAEQATRFLTPMALLIIDFWPPRLKPGLTLTRASIGLLRLGTCATFAAHGLVAIYQFRHGGNFVDLILFSFEKVFQYDVERELAQNALAVIGALDVAVALSLLTSRSRALALWMAFWGLLTACSRTLAYGLEGYDMTLIRIANGGAPLAILIFWVSAVREQKPNILPDLD